MDTLDSRIDEPTNVSIWPVALKWGVIGGVISVLYGQLAQTVGISDPFGQEGAAPWTVLLVSVAMYVVMGILAVRDVKTALGGYISFGKAFGAVFVTALIIALVGAVWQIIYSSLIYPEYYADLDDFLVEQYEDGGMAEDQIEAAMSFTRMSFNPLGALIGALVGGAFFGGIFGLIIAAVMKKDRGYA